MVRQPPGHGEDVSIPQHTCPTPVLPATASPPDATQISCGMPQFY